MLKTAESQDSDLLVAHLHSTRAFLGHVLFVNVAQLVKGFESLAK